MFTKPGGISENEHPLKISLDNWGGKEPYFSQNINWPQTFYFGGGKENETLRQKINLRHSVVKAKETRRDKSLPKTRSEYRN